MEEETRLLYCISSHPSDRYKYAVMDYDYYMIESVPCGKCGRTTQRLHLLYWPPKIRFEGGKRYPDCLSVSVPFEDRCGIIVSERVLTVFEKEQLSGFEATPIEVSGVETDAPRYYYLTVTGSVSLDYRAMHYRKKNVCPDCGSFHWSRQKIGVSALDYASWDGSDFCKLVDYPNIFMCSPKVVDVIRAKKLKGFTMRMDAEIFLPLRDGKIC